jgi:hypothetical protein
VQERAQAALPPQVVQDLVVVEVVVALLELPVVQDHKIQYGHRPVTVLQQVQEAVQVLGLADQTVVLFLYTVQVRQVTI